MLSPVEHAPLAPHCTLRIGGPARYLVEAIDEATVAEAHAWASARRLPVRVLGGGSNLVIADEGVDGLVLKIALRGVTERPGRDGVEVTAAAGEPWDALVRHTVDRGWAGLECLSGIPGLVGATPIQNVGAYGQEVSDTVTMVRALDGETGQVVTLGPADCGFGYRDSLFKSRAPGRYVVLAVTYRLAPGGAPNVRYADIARELEARAVARPSLIEVRETVLKVRRSKSMVLDPGDPNARSCGSFFLNPIVDAEALAAIDARATGLSMPRWPQPDGRVKLSAAWLIERAGFTRGQADGPVGLSTRHTLAIVCHDGARARDVVAFARRVRAGVEQRFGVRLHPEPIFWGAPGLD
jgi:UDP-N-acetylmuramate dehydrogenase